MASYTFLDYDMTWFSKANSGPGKDWPIKAGDPVVGSRNWRGGFSCVIVELSTMIMVLGLYSSKCTGLAIRSPEFKSKFLYWRAMKPCI